MNIKSCLIIIPCFNEANRIDLDRFSAYLKTTDVSILFVNDGSKDDTLSLLEQFCSTISNASVLNLEKNVGKASAIRQGMLASDSTLYKYMGYFDADLATPLSEIENLLATTKGKEPIFILGSRVKLLGFSEINRKPARHYIGRVFATVVSKMLNLPIYDTQCGAKLIRSDFISPLFNQDFTSKWLFDVELLFRLKHLDANLVNKIIEVPLKKWEDVKGSKIKLSYYFQAPFDLLQIFFRYR